jgi:hypothetical protein
MNEIDQIKAIAELDGWKFWCTPHYGHDGKWHCEPYKGKDIWDAKHSAWAGKPVDIQYDLEEELPNYITSRDAIIPVIEKQDDDTRQRFFYELLNLRGLSIETTSAWNYTINITHLQFADAILATPAQLAEALLRATGKWRTE